MQKEQLKRFAITIFKALAFWWFPCLLIFFSKKLQESKHWSWIVFGSLAVCLTTYALGFELKRNLYQKHFDRMLNNNTMRIIQNEKNGEFIQTFYFDGGGLVDFQSTGRYLSNAYIDNGIKVFKNHNAPYQCRFDLDFATKSEKILTSYGYHYEPSLFNLRFEQTFYLNWFGFWRIIPLLLRTVDYPMRNDDGSYDADLTETYYVVESYINYGQKEVYNQTHDNSKVKVYFEKDPF